MGKHRHSEIIKAWADEDSPHWDNFKWDFRIKKEKTLEDRVSILEHRFEEFVIQNTKGAGK